MQCPGLLSAFALLGLAVSACRGDDPEALRSVADIQSTSARSYAWAGGRVEVCFINNSSDGNGKNLVKQIVESNFNKNSTLIEFFGFADCGSESVAPARVRFNVPKSFSRQLGTFAIQQQAPFGETIGLPPAENPYAFYNSVVHQFAHFAGLVDDNRLEGREDSTCKNDLKNNGSIGEAPAALPGFKAMAFGPTDRKSIMNTCILGLNNQYLRLSDGDVKALRMLYEKVSDATAQIASSSANSQDQNAMSAAADECKQLKIVPAEVAKYSVGNFPSHTSDGAAVYAYKDETLSASAEAGTLKVGSDVLKVASKPFNKDSPNSSGQNLTAMQVIPQSGDLKGQKVWIVGNVTVVHGCK